MARPVVIVGGGLAGTTLAWRLHERGMEFCLVDDGQPHSSSRVAAGLITPITGLRPTVTWRWHTLSDSAFRFYPKIEALLGTRFFYPREAVRIFGDDRERQLFLRCADRVTIGEAELANAFHAPFGAMTMAPAARLDVPTYLAASHKFFQQTNRYTITTMKATDFSARPIVFTQGYRLNQLFMQIPFAASRGEILTLRLSGLNEPRTVNRQGTWLTHLSGDMYRAGSTYDKTDLTTGPTDSGREQILAKLKTFLKAPIEVQDHQAAVRPIIRTSQPVVGCLPEDRELCFFNGLGSKGSLTAPWAANELANFLCEDQPIDPEIELGRYLASKLPERPSRS